MSSNPSLGQYRLIMRYWGLPGDSYTYRGFSGHNNVYRALLGHYTAYQDDSSKYHVNQVLSRPTDASRCHLECWDHISFLSPAWASLSRTIIITHGYFSQFETSRTSIHTYISRHEIRRASILCQYGSISVATRPNSQRNSDFRARGPRPHLAPTEFVTDTTDDTDTCLLACCLIEHACPLILLCWMMHYPPRSHHDTSLGPLSVIVGHVDTLVSPLHYLHK